MVGTTMHDHLYVTDAMSIAALGGWAVLLVILIVIIIVAAIAAYYAGENSSCEFKVKRIKRL